jgi:ribosomal protein L28
MVSFVYHKKKRWRKVWLINYQKTKKFAPAWVRTTDLQVNSLALYLLSYKSLVKDRGGLNFIDFGFITKISERKRSLIKFCLISKEKKGFEKLENKKKGTNEKMKSIAYIGIVNNKVR